MSILINKPYLRYLVRYPPNIHSYFLKTSLEMPLWFVQMHYLESTSRLISKLSRIYCILLYYLLLQLAYLTTINLLLSYSTFFLLALYYLSLSTLSPYFLLYFFLLPYSLPLLSPTLYPHSFSFHYTHLILS